MLGERVSPIDSRAPLIVSGPRALVGMNVSYRCVCGDEANE